MRHLFIALLVLLLPLRGWVGDAMATNMAGSVAVNKTNATKTIADNLYGAIGSGHFEHQIPADTPAGASPAAALQDCPEHVSAKAAPFDQAHDANNAQDAHCNPCQSCEVCHTAALLAAPPDMPGVFPAPSTPRSVATLFTSAPTALGQKPPIS